MALSAGNSEIVVGLVDGPVALNHPDLADQSSRHQTENTGHSVNDAACAHGTFIAGMLAARRGSAAPAICPDCTLSLETVFTETTAPGEVPRADPDALAAAILRSIAAGARVVNLSLSLVPLHRDYDSLAIFG
jgi:hypothetical protein